MSAVLDYADERARRVEPAGIELDTAIGDAAGDEIAEALARAAALPEPAPQPVAGLSPLEHQWLRFRDAFAEAMQGGPYRIEDLEQMVLSGAAYLWPGKDAAVVAKRVIYPSGEALMETLWAVGDMAEVLTLAPAIEATARLVGCSGVLVEGRAGWQRVLASHGYEPWSVTVRKEL